MAEQITIEMSAACGNIGKALVAAQGLMTHAPKDHVNPHFKNRYADLPGVIDTVKDALLQNGIAFVQFATSSPGHAGCVTMFLHTSGEWMRGTLLLPLAKNDPQGAGSAITYARRYALAAMAGIGQDDDDGNDAAGHRGNDREPPRRATGNDAPPVSPAQKNEIGRLLDVCGYKGDERAQHVAHIAGHANALTMKDASRVIDELRAEADMAGKPQNNGKTNGAARA
jgi:hypothetical protein